MYQVFAHPSLKALKTYRGPKLRGMMLPVAAKCHRQKAAPFAQYAEFQLALWLPPVSKFCTVSIVKQTLKLQELKWGVCISKSSMVMGFSSLNHFGVPPFMDTPNGSENTRGSPAVSNRWRCHSDLLSSCLLKGVPPFMDTPKWVWKYKGFTCCIQSLALSLWSTIRLFAEYLRCC